MIAGFVFASTSLKTAAISRMSEGVIPRVVTAGVPTRRPLVYHGPFVSNGKALRFKVMWHERIADSACRPVSPKLLCTSRSSRWLSVPPVSTSIPSARHASASAWAFWTMRRA